MPGLVHVKVSGSIHEPRSLELRDLQGLGFRVRGLGFIRFRA